MKKHTWVIRLIIVLLLLLVALLISVSAKAQEPCDHHRQVTENMVCHLVKQLPDSASREQWAEVAVEWWLMVELQQREGCDTTGIMMRCRALVESTGRVPYQGWPVVFGQFGY